VRYLLSDIKEHTYGFREKMVFERLFGQEINWRLDADEKGTVESTINCVVPSKKTKEGIN
jgi:hypothetical protein